jgi:hypothetical protein
VKIAVQIFGHLRTFEQCAPTLREHLLDRYPDHDVFVHTWDRLEAETVTDHERFCLPSPVDEQTLAAVSHHYRPTRVSVEPQKERELGDVTRADGRRISISGIRYMFASMQRANQLREAHCIQTGTTYQAVVVVRPDVALRRPLDLEAALAYSRPPALGADETTRTRYVAFGPVPPIVNDLRGVVGTEQLFFGRPGVITRALKLSDELDNYDLKAELAASRHRQLLNTYCADVGIQIALIDYISPRDFDVVRA